jgi:hypothetical protein
MNPRSVKWLFWLALSGWLAAGCATKTKALWNSRIGNFTLDQTVLQMGPPDKVFKLTDGTMVAEWMTMRGQPGRSFTSMYAYPGVWIEPSSPDVFLRLTFGPDGKLREWRKVFR